MENLTNKVTNPNIIFDDNFSEGDMGWVQLATPSATATELGACFLEPRGAFSGKSFAVRTNDTPSTSIFGVGMMLKRVGQFNGEGKYLIEFWTSVKQITSDETRPRYYIWGLDTAASDGTRRFFELRYVNYDEALAAPSYKWQIKTGASTWVDITGSNVWKIPVNENKDLVFYIAIEVDTNTGKYHGVRVNKVFELGSLAPTPDSSIEDLGAVGTSDLDPFSTGLNATLAVINRSSGTLTQGQLNLHRARLTYLGS